MQNRTPEHLRSGFSNFRSAISVALHYIENILTNFIPQAVLRKLRYGNSEIPGEVSATPPDLFWGAGMHAVAILRYWDAKSRKQKYLSNPPPPRSKFCGMWISCCLAITAPQMKMNTTLKNVEILRPSRKFFEHVCQTDLQFSRVWCTLKPPPPGQSWVPENEKKSHETLSGGKGVLENAWFFGKHENSSSKTILLKTDFKKSGCSQTVEITMNPSFLNIFEKSEILENQKPQGSFGRPQLTSSPLSSSN